MKREKRAMEGVIRKLTEENAERIIKKYAGHSCRGGVQLSFDVNPEAIPDAIWEHCGTDREGRPDCLMMSTKGRVVNGSIEGYPLRMWAGEDLETIHVPIAAICSKIFVTWHEWAENTQS